MPEATDKHKRGVLDFDLTKLSRVTRNERRTRRCGTRRHRHGQCVRGRHLNRRRRGRRRRRRRCCCCCCSDNRRSRGGGCCCCCCAKRILHGVQAGRAPQARSGHGNGEEQVVSLLFIQISLHTHVDCFLNSFMFVDPAMESQDVVLNPMFGPLAQRGLLAMQKKEGAEAQGT